MIRIYLDWNIITELKKDGGGKYASLKRKITQYKNALQFPFSNYHIEDLIRNNKSESAIKKYVIPDLEYLNELSQQHFLGIGKKNELLVQLGNPLDFLETIDFDDDISQALNINQLFENLNMNIEGLPTINTGDLLKSAMSLIEVPEELKTAGQHPLTLKMLPNISNASSFVDILQDYANFNQSLFTDREFMKQFRIEVQKASLVKTDNHGNWAPEVAIKNIEEALKLKGIEQSFQELIRLSFEGKKEITRSLFYITSYLMLDWYGYKSDKLEKPSNTFQNITNDANHSFLAAYCDYLVSDDGRMLAKSKALYYEFKLNTKVLTPLEFDKILDSIVHFPLATPQDILNLAISFIDNKYLYEEPNEENYKDNRTTIYRLPLYFLNYFNFLLLEELEGDIIMLRFRKVFHNYSDFVYYTETAQLLKDLVFSLGKNNEGETFEEIEQKYLHDEIKKIDQVIWSFNNVHFILEKEKELYRDSLRIIIENKSNKKNNDTD